MIADVTVSSLCSFTPEDIIRDVKHLPSAPKVLPRLKQLLQDGNTAIHEIVAMIRLDPGIAARVLQVANSALYSKGTRCLTVEEAVQRVGYDEVYELVAYAVASQVLIRPLEIYGVEADAMWLNAVACAMAAETLANRTKLDRNVAYTIGLLHGVGMVAFNEWSLCYAPRLVLRSAGLPREATEAERATFGFTQAEVGSALLRHWNFPTAMSEPVRWQYAPRASAGHVQMASLLLAAKWLRSSVCVPAKLCPPLPDPAQLQPIGLSGRALDEMLPEVELRLAEVSSMLDLGDEAAARPPRGVCHLFPRQDWPARG